VRFSRLGPRGRCRALDRLGRHDEPSREATRYRDRLAIMAPDREQDLIARMLAIIAFLVSYSSSRSGSVEPRSPPGFCT
jgi:hypothetical protein